MNRYQSAGYQGRMSSAVLIRSASPQSHRDKGLFFHA